MKQNLKNYKKIYIIGAVGSGKTTFTRKLSRTLNLPHTEVDVICWDDSKSERRHRTDNERTKYLNNVLKSDKWIIDGAQCAEWTEPIWKSCDIVIMKKTYLIKRIFWILKRYILCEEEKQKKAPITYLWKNIVWTVQFDKTAKKRFEALSKKYNKPILFLSKYREL